MIDQQRDQRGQAKAAWTLFLLCVAAIIPFWTVRYPVVVDYPNHLARWFILFHMRDGAYHFAKLYAPAWGPLPYISPDVLAMGLQYFLPIDIVGRIILSLCVILVAYAMYFFLKVACPENLVLASFGVFMALNPNLELGTISNEFSVAFGLLVVGLWVMYCQSPKVKIAVGVAVGILVVYLSHLTGFVVSGLVMGVYALFQEKRWKRLGVLAAASLPAILIFIFDHSVGGGGDSVQYGTLGDKVRSVIFPLRLYWSKALDLIVLAGLILIVVLVLQKRPKSILQPVWLVVCAILLLAYCIAPSYYGWGGFVDKRFLIFFYLFLLAVFRLKEIPRFLYIGLVLLALCRVAVWETMFISQQNELEQLAASLETIPRDARVLPLGLPPARGALGTAGIRHAEYGVVQRGFLDPTVFHLPGVQPIRLVGSSYCLNALCDLADEATVDWQQVANSYDYLWVYNDPEIKALASRVGDVIFSSDSACVTVYRVRRHSL